MLTYRSDGSGEPLVLLNGGLMTIGSWEPFMKLLGDGFRFIRCDFHGQLLSGAPYRTTFDEHAADVLEVLDAVGVERAHVLGTSFGGEVALLLAANAPDRVTTVTVMNSTDRTTPAMRDDARRLRDAAESAAKGGDREVLLRIMGPRTFSESWLRNQEGDFIERRAKAVGALPPEFFAGAATILTPLDTLDLTPLLGRITAPALIIGADNDLTFPPEHSRAIADAIPGARLEIVRNSGHATIVEQPERAAELFLDFVRRPPVTETG